MRTSTPEPLFADFEDTIVRPARERAPGPDLVEVEALDGEFVLEAPSVEAAVEDVRDRTGREPEVLEVERFARGGIGGFFAREMVRVRVRVGGNPTDQHARQTPQAPRVAEARAQGVDGVLAALASANDEQERSFEAELRAALTEGRPVRPADLTPAPVDPIVTAPTPPPAPAAASAPAPAADPVTTPRPEPTVAQPVVAQPVVAQPVVAQPVVAERAVPEPAVAPAEPAEPAVAERVIEVVDAVEEPMSVEAIIEETAVEEAVVIESAAPAPAPAPQPVHRPLIPDEVRARIEGESSTAVAAAPAAQAPTETASAPAVRMSSRVAQRAAEAQVAAAAAVPAAPVPAPAQAPTVAAAAPTPTDAAPSTSVVARPSPRVAERARRLSSGSPIAASRAVLPGHRWTLHSLYAVGLPAAVIDRLDVPIGADEFTWLRAMAEAVAPWCRRLPSGSSVLAGPQAEALGSALELPTCRVGDRPPYGGDVALAADDSGTGHAWINEVRGDRWVHLVVGGTRWEGLLATEPRAISLVGRGDIATALSLCAKFDLVLGHLMDDPTTGRAIRCTPLDVATAVRDLLPRAEGR